MIFVTSSLALIALGLPRTTRREGIGTQNIVLFAINVIGVYRYLIRKKPVHARRRRHEQYPPGLDPPSL